MVSIEALATVTSNFSTSRIQPGTYCVETEGKREIVYVAGPLHDQWAFWNGQVFRLKDRPIEERDGRTPRAHGSQALAAPMPAKVVKVLVAAGAPVQHGDTLIVLEAMKMELPIRATGDGTVKAVHCREGELVHPEHVLIELT